MTHRVLRITVIGLLLAVSQASWSAICAFECGWGNRQTITETPQEPAAPPGCHSASTTPAGAQLGSVTLPCDTGASLAAVSDRTPTRLVQQHVAARNRTADVSPIRVVAGFLPTRLVDHPQTPPGVRLSLRI